MRRGKEYESIESKISLLLEHETSFKKKYKVELKLGSGAYGIVYKVTPKVFEKELPDPLALKILSGDLMRDPETTINEIKKNIDICKNRSCQNVVSFFSYNEYTYSSYRYLCLEMELCDGGTLKKSIFHEKKYATDAFRKKILKESISGMLFIHECGFAHWDIHGENILFKSPTDDTIKFSDFGLTRESPSSQKLDVRDLGETLLKWLFLRESNFSGRENEFELKNLLKTADVKKNIRNILKGLTFNTMSLSEAKEKMKEIKEKDSQDGKEKPLSASSASDKEKDSQDGKEKSLSASSASDKDDSFCQKDGMQDNEDNGLAAIVNKRGSTIRFNNLRLDIIKEISDKEMDSLKASLKVTMVPELSKEKKKTVEDIKTKEKFFSFAIDEGIFQERNVIMMQYLLRSIGRSDLELKCIEYAKKDKQVLCYFEITKPPGDGYKYVQLHVTDDIKQFTNLEALVETVAEIVRCDKSCIELVGVLPAESFIIVISMKEEFERALLQLDPQKLTKLKTYNVDWIKNESKSVSISQGKDLENDSSPWADQSEEQSSSHQTQQTINERTNEETLRNERTNEETLRNVHAVIMHAEADRMSAQIFKAELKRSAPDMEVEMLQEFSHPGKTHFENLDQIFENNHFVFLWVSRNLGDDKELLQMFLADISLTESQSNRERDKFIPIWGQANARSLYSKFKPLTGFNFHDDKKDDFNKLRSIINKANKENDDIDLK